LILMRESYQWHLPWYCTLLVATFHDSQDISNFWGYNMFTIHCEMLNRYLK
jgi:hypothetical protein